ncbi:lipocalin-like domain-containing protein [Burkholderia lata]|uniref:lipocalin-like domain-containing protein n=1 Tax=Burkholderia lata (strain ATCC 17760 / DSM 23089 / LMG 22485 / NCIMB 9086 / R18194 / 383) TaxID=482957 RepID=UPI0015839914|nr:lipocalin-like domain-containing protein [Burkholderia lata]MBN3780451.1 lipocalin-like domain-containing protein [Burkholderia sp. Ac-20345]
MAVNHIHIVPTVSRLVLLGLALQSGVALSQQSLDQQLAGAWAYVSVDTVHPDGSRTPMYGPNPHGLVIFDGHGHYALVNSRGDLPKYVSNDRMNGSAEEYRAVVQGSIAHFGTYVVNEADKTITFRIDTSTFPNWNGVEQRRPFVLSGDELRWTTPAASGGGSGEVVLRRAK